MATLAPWRNRIVGQGEEAPDQLVANPLNWRTHPGSQRDALRGSLATVGWVQQVLVNRQTGNVVDGHARVEEALSRHEKSVPVLYVDLDPDEERLVLASLDPIGAMAIADNQKLDELLADLHVDDAGLDALLRELAPPKKMVGLTDPDEVPPLGDGIHIKRGDTFALGTHVITCGDATSAEDVKRLFEEPPALLLTDPPYGLDRNLARARGRAWRIKNDNPVDAPLMYEACKALWDAPERYVWGQWNAWAHLVDALGEPDNCIVWVKGNMGMGHGYRHQHEFLAYWGSRSFPSQSDVWESPRDYSGLHPTIKPVDLCERAIANSSAKGDVVADIFLGSGTTVIAAEQSQRRCYGMEIDPRYVAVTIARWENFTGKKAERL